jgi:hypothetical protein
MTMKPINEPKQIWLQNGLGESPDPFIVNRLAVDPNDLSSWDLSVFGRPQHPTFKTKRDRLGKKVLHEMKSHYLLLKFPDASQKEKFEVLLNDQLNKRNALANGRIYAERMIMEKEHTPYIARSPTQSSMQALSPRESIAGPGSPKSP